MNKYIQNIIKFISIGLVYHTITWMLYDIHGEKYFANFSKNALQVLMILTMSKLLEIILNIVYIKFKKDRR